MDKVNDGAPREKHREPKATNDEVVPELILALVGDSNSMEKGPRNLLIDHDEHESEKSFSSKLYDLCGRHICVLNMLDLPNIDSIPSNQEVHAFILLVANGQHISHYRSGMQWLEKTFGKQCFPYVITVVTHNPHENCENAVTDLKAFGSFSEKRYQKSKRRMDEKELVALLEKIDVMISENKPPCCSFMITDTKEDQKGGVITGVELLSHEDQEQIRSFIKNVEQKSLEIIQSKPVATRGYTSTYLHEVAKNVQENVTEFESNTKITFNKKFTVDLLLFVFHKASGWILKSHKTYKDNNDVLNYLNSKKNEYFNIFIRFCKGSSSAVVFGEMICEKLKVSAVEAVCNQTAVDLAGELRCNVPAFNGNRLNLKKHVLKDLAEREDFNKFITYIRDPRKQVEGFIKEKVKTFIVFENNNKAHKILQKNSDDIQRFIRQTLFEATEKIKTEKGDINMWVKEISSSLRCKMRLDTISCHNFRDINNFDFLRDEIEKGLQIISKEMKDLPLVEVMKYRQKPDEILIDQLCNCCWERCPFCGAVCINTIKDHSPDKHSVPFHRPSRS
ncbi:Interferon-induced very large GTPase 1 [Oryzias melastigma]|uniref:Interferon-induced very large GTPase 1 n=1 Tax=Oryzias melastigma TaxID=30732 RepID=A0A834C2M3_ORYME|nr:Interferon-induced very large GTPase 1 [Oryzias melastigma]